MRPFPILFLLLSAAPPAFGADARLLVDLETTGEPLFDSGIISPPAPIFGSNPSQLLPLPAPVGGVPELWFVADDRTHGAELWRTDGTVAGTSLLMDICPGPCSAAPEILGRLGDRSVVFWARTEESGTEPWISDGTATGTIQLADVCPGPCDGRQTAGLDWMRPLREEDSVRVGGDLYFLGRSPEHGLELWRTDGSPAGTGIVADVCPGPCDGMQRDWDLARAGDRVVAAANDGQLGIELWSFGVDGAHPLDDFCPGSVGSSNIWELVPAAGGRVLFAPTCRNQDGKLFATDGTAAGTRLLASLPEDRDLPAWLWHGASLPDGRAALYFLFVGSPSPNQIWASDGTPEGTTVLSDQVPDSFDDLIPFATGVALRTRDGGLWTSDGSSEGTGPTGLSGVLTLAAADGSLLLTSRPNESSVLFRWDGSAEGLQPLGEVEAGPTPSPGLEVGPVGDVLVFAGWQDPGEGAEPWSVERELPDPAPRCPAADPEALCLDEGRFEVRVRWTDQRTGANGPGRAVPSTESTGHFWFFDASNLEMTLKILDATAVNSAHWMFSGAISDVAAEITVTDHANGIERTWTKEPGDLCGLADIDAFPSFEPNTGGARILPRPASRAVVTDPTLELQDGRFEIRVSWTDPRTGQSGTGRAVTLEESEQTGFFWFFSEENLELLVKVLDGRAINGSWWFLWGGLTDLELDLEVVDLETSRVLTTSRPSGSLCGDAILDAFPDPPG